MDKFEKLRERLERMLEQEQKQVMGFYDDYSIAYHDGQEQMLENILDLMKGIDNDEA